MIPHVVLCSVESLGRTPEETRANAYTGALDERAVKALPYLFGTPTAVLDSSPKKMRMMLSKVKLKKPCQGFSSIIHLFVLILFR